MKVTNVKNLYSYIASGRFVGFGKTAVCYRISNGRLLKLYLNTFYTEQLFKNRDMMEHLELLNSVSNDSFIGPEEILVKDGKIVGYIYPFIKARTLQNIPLSTKLSQLQNNFNKLIEDTIEISEKRFELIDVHNKNILFDGNKYYVIDLDEGRLSNREDPKLDIIHNNKEITNTVINSYFKGDNKHIIEFINPNLDLQYRRVHWTNKDEVNALFDAFKRECRVDDPSLRVMRSRIYNNIKIDDYKLSRYL